MLPMDSIQTLPDGRKGRVVSHCRGLWQLNNRAFRWPATDAQAFDPLLAARCAWVASRRGRDWGKWTVMRNGRAFDEAVLERARGAARKVDETSLGGVPGERIEGRVTSGFIRTEPAGDPIRSFHRGDSGRLVRGPILAEIKQGAQRSLKLWWQAVWDTGETGWVAEDLLMRSASPEPQGAAPVSEGNPHRAFHIPRRPVFAWTQGGNTVTNRVYVGTTSTLNRPGDLRYEGRTTAWTADFDLPWGTRIWWRVDSLGGNGAWTTGPVWTFCTVLPPAGLVTLTNLNADPSPAQAGWRITITGTASTQSPQPVVVGASLVSGTTVLSNPANDRPLTISGVTPVSRFFDIPVTAAPGTWTLRVALWQDADGDGVIGPADRQFAQAMRTLYIGRPGPRVASLTAAPLTVTPGSPVTLTAVVAPQPGSTLTALRLYRSLPGFPDSWQPVASRTLTPPSAGGSFVFTDAPPAVARYRYAVDATDSAGRSAPEQALFRPVEVNATYNDFTPPLIQWNVPVDGGSAAAFSDATGTVTDNDQVARFEYAANGGPWQQVFLFGSSSWSVQLPGLTGTHRVAVRAVDRSGNVATQERFIYLGPTGGATSSDDERLRFDGNAVPSHWLVSPSFDPEGLAGVRNERLEATGGGVAATVSSFKRASGEHHAEVGWRCGPAGAGIEWDTQFFNRFTVRLVRNGAGWALETGPPFSPQTHPFTIPAGRPVPDMFTVFAIVTGDRLFVRVGRPVTPWEVFHQINVPLQTGGTGSLGTLTLRVAGESGPPAWLDDFSVRFVPPDLALQVRDWVPMPRGGFSFRWLGYEGRSYLVEYLVDGRWDHLDGPLITATNLLPGTIVPGIDPQRGFHRIRQVMP